METTNLPTFPPVAHLNDKTVLVKDLPLFQRVLEAYSEHLAHRLRNIANEARFVRQHGARVEIRPSGHYPGKFDLLVQARTAEQAYAVEGFVEACSVYEE